MLMIDSLAVKDAYYTCDVINFGIAGLDSDVSDAFTKTDCGSCLDGTPEN